MPISPETLSYFAYGAAVTLKIRDKPRDMVMAFSESNYSFIEFVWASSFAIERAVNLFHVRSVRLEKETRLLIRLRKPDLSFVVGFASPKLAEEAAEHFGRLLMELREVPFCEFSAKNLVRQVLYDTGLANFGNNYSVENLMEMLERIGVHMDSAALDKLLSRSVINLEQVTIFDFRRVFKILLLKEELAPLFKQLLKMPDSELIKKRRMPLELLLDHSRQKQGEDLPEHQLVSFLRQIRSANPFNIEQEPVFDLDFEEFCIFFFSPLNSAVRPKSPMSFDLLDLSLKEFFCGSAINSCKLSPRESNKMSLEGLMRSIERGARSLDLHFVDGPDGHPVVSDEQGNRSELTAESTLRFLKTIGFMYTDLPLVLQLSTTCSRTQREALKDALFEVFGNSLYLLTKDQYFLDSPPKMRELLGKVLVRFQAPYPNFMVEEDGRVEEESRSIEIREGLEAITALIDERFVSSGLKSVFGVGKLTHGFLAEVGKKEAERIAVQDFCKGYFTSLSCENHSIGEQKNLSPFAGWTLGVQFVGVDTRLPDIYALASQTLFDPSIHGGWIEKPIYMREGGSAVSFLAPRLSFFVRVLSAQVLSIGEIRPEKVFPFVEMQVLGRDIDVQLNPPVTSRICNGNLFHCSFEDDVFGYRSTKISETTHHNLESEFPASKPPSLGPLTNDNNISTSREVEEDVEQTARRMGYHRVSLFNPELAFIVFELVNAKNSSVLKRGIIPAANLRRGVRSVPLFNPFHDSDSFSALLVDIDIINISSSVQPL